MTTQNNSVKKSGQVELTKLSPEQLKELLAGVSLDTLKQALPTETIQELGKKEKKPRTWRTGRNCTPRFENNKLYLEIDLSPENIANGKLSESKKTFLIASINSAIPEIQDKITVNMNVYRSNPDYKPEEGETKDTIEVAKEDYTVSK